MTPKTLTPSRIFFGSCVACIAGIAGLVWQLADMRFAWGVVGAALVFAGLGLAGRRRFFVGAIWCSAAFVGMLTAQGAMERANANEIWARFEAGQNVSLKGQIVREPDRRQSRTNFTILPEGLRRSFVLVSMGAAAASEFRYGDIVHVEGTIEKPPVFDDFNYRAYLEKDKVYALMESPAVRQETERAYRGIWQRAYGTLLDWKNVMNGAIENALPRREGILLKALLFGSDGEMPDDMKDVFNKTGVRHMVAVSGQHVAILVPLLLFLFLSCGVRKRPALAWTLVAILLFIALTGMSASAVRAGIMGTMALGAKMLGRMSSPLRPLALAATAMLILNPLLISRDLGFQLSFAATLGIILLYPWLRESLPLIPKKGFIGDALALTISAQVFTLPLSIGSFHYVSLVSPLTNAIAAPLMPMFMIFGIIFLYGSLVSPMFGALLGTPIALALRFFELLMGAFSRIPFAFVEGASASFMFVFLYGIGVVWLVRISRQRSRDMVYWAV